MRGFACKEAMAPRAPPCEQNNREEVVTVTAGTPPDAASALTAPWQLEEAGDSLVTRLLQACGQLRESPLEAARTAEQLFPEARQREDLAPWLALVTAICGRIETLSDFHPLDPFIAFFDERRSALDAPEAVLAQIDVTTFGALVFRQPDHPRIAELAERSEAIFQGDQMPSADDFVRLSAANYLMIHRIWCGDLTGADALHRRMAALRESAGDVYSRLLCHSMSSMILRLYLRYDQCAREIEQGLALARQTGFHAWDSQFHMQGAMLALTLENTEEARRWLEPMGELAPPEHSMDRAGYHYCLGWLHSLEEDLPLAIRHAEESVQLAQRSGGVFPQAVTHVGLGQLYLEQRRISAGLYHFVRARRVGRRMQSSRPVQFIRGLLDAHLAFRMGMHRRGCRALQQALAIGREEYYLNFPWWRGQLVAGLCVKALEEDIETEYVRTLIRTRRLRLPDHTHPPANWYWPLEVQVLGVRSVLLDGADPGLSRQLFNLLLMLACLGDQEGWVSRERLIDSLWPDSEGDQGQRALDTSIHRLRKQLGSERLIGSRPGRVRLDLGLCRVDYRELLACLDKEQPDVRDIGFMLEVMDCLNKGHANPWLPPVDTLQHRIAARILSLARGPFRGHEQVPQWLETLAGHLPASEHVWQGLIRHHLEQGMHSDALETWERCCRALDQHRGVEPSPATRALLREIPGRRVV